jgi:DNA-binding NtrC family response regulator
LLRVLQEREVDRLGDTRPLPVDVRVIATTNRSLRAHVDAGQFRADLFYRLHVVPLAIPPLRERREDILPLAEYFLRKHEEGARPGAYRLSPELIVQLENHSWPGNVRELENVIRRSLALASGLTLGPQPLDGSSGFPVAEKSAGLKSGVTLHEVERQLLAATLDATGGNRTKAAELMGVSLRTVRNKIREYGMPARRPS